MSGGRFQYKQYELGYIADEIEQVIIDNKNDSDDGWGSTVGGHYSDATIERLREGVCHLKLALVYAQRADWLLSGDDGEDSFHKRLNAELAEFGLGPEDDTPSPHEWTRTEDQAPQRNDGDERGMVWIDDGLQVITCRWDKVTAPYWQPRSPRVKPGRAERM